MLPQRCLVFGVRPFRSVSVSFLGLSLLAGHAQVQTSRPPSETEKPSESIKTSATREPSKVGNHSADTNPGREPHGSDRGQDIATGVGAGLAIGLLTTALIKHHDSEPSTLSHNGPELPKQFGMNHFVVKGLIGPNWPLALDFKLDAPGAVQIDIIASDRHHTRITMTTNTSNYRAIGKARLPETFGTKVQIALFQIQTVALPGSNTPAPQLHTYGLAAGERAVGSIAIDQVTFGPSVIHPQAKETADYGFHAHSDFSGARAEFVFTTLYQGQILVEKDQEQKLAAVPQNEMTRGTWAGKGKPGEHMLQVRAWRGLEDGGDWVVAWSPDIVDVVK